MRSIVQLQSRGRGIDIYFVLRTHDHQVQVLARTSENSVCIEVEIHGV